MSAGATGRVSIREAGCAVIRTAAATFEGSRRQKVLRLGLTASAQGLRLRSSSDVESAKVEERQFVVDVGGAGFEPATSCL
jgi:hypothetical protein